MTTLEERWKAIEMLARVELSIKDRYEGISHTKGRDYQEVVVHAPGVLAALGVALQDMRSIHNATGTANAKTP